MAKFYLTRRGTISAALGAGLTRLLPLRAVAAETQEYTNPVDTAAGKLRGLARGDVAAFLGIPYGSDTGPLRFRPSPPAPAWTGVRDCFSFGAWAPQQAFPLGNNVGPDASDAVKAVAAMFQTGSASNAQESEECLFLDVYTPDASPARKRPVMVWLHGGGFTSGAGGTPTYDGSNLCRQGDVVVVTVNHRLNAMGYLHLGGIHDDFADSGNTGQLDIVLALQWVRDNIEAFGGDPDNVTIFGESGGGSKVGALLGMPPAAGLFHKAIIQSGTVVRMVDKDVAEGVAERTLDNLGVAKADVHNILDLDPETIINASASAQQGAAGRRAIGPVADGRSLPRHPFDPEAPEISRDVPMIIGTNKDEATLFTVFDPRFGKMTADEARQRFNLQAGDKAAAAFEIYSSRRPDDQPTYWVTDMLTDSGVRADSITAAERKAAQKAAPAYMYRLDWETSLGGGALRAPHGIDVGLVFGNPGLALGDDTDQVSAAMSTAWINFAHTGNPSQNGLAWPKYDAIRRRTMIFDTESRVVADPDPETRALWVEG